jgi:hypothetical protein
MQVNPTGSQSPIPQTAAGAAARAGRAAQSAGAPAGATDAESFALTGELTALLAAVKQTPEVRAAVIESVAARLAAGELATPEAAADAARTLLASGDLTPPE